MQKKVIKSQDQKSPKVQKWHEYELVITARSGVWKHLIISDSRCFCGEGRENTKEGAMRDKRTLISPTSPV